MVSLQLSVYNNMLLNNNSCYIDGEGGSNCSYLLKDGRNWQTDILKATYVHVLPCVL